MVTNIHSSKKILYFIKYTFLKWYTDTCKDLKNLISDKLQLIK